MIDIVLVKYIAGTCSSEIQKGFPETPGNPPRHAPALGNISHVSTEEHIATDTNLIPR